MDPERGVLDALELVIRDWFKSPTLLLFQDGATAWQELSQTDPDLLLIGIFRPGTTGWEIISRLAERRIKYPILVMSAYTEEDELRRRASPTLNISLLQKPFQCATLCEQLSIHLGPSDNPDRRILKGQS